MEILFQPIAEKDFKNLVKKINHCYLNLSSGYIQLKIIILKAKESIKIGRFIGFLFNQSVIELYII